MTTADCDAGRRETGGRVRLGSSPLASGRSDPGRLGGLGPPPERLDLRWVVEAGLALRPEDPWHQRPGEDERWCWHASSLASCPRQQILARAGLATDGTPLSGMLNFEVGHRFHAFAEECLAAVALHFPELEIVAIEQGYRHSELPLVAKPDAVVRWRGRTVLVELKTEHELSAKHRKGEARWEHVIQTTAAAMCVEDAGLAVEDCQMLYASKNNFWLDPQSVDVRDPGGRYGVQELLSGLEEAWAEYAASGVLPPALDPQRDATAVWQCKPREPSEREGEADQRGRYCPARSSCVSALLRGA